MDLKKKLKRFFTLTRKANDGFTLVELIVVIAILAILAGVGRVGYSGYIKAANKGNDKVLVGEVMRAIEMGTYSTMFTNNDSFKMGNISYPVGFIALTTDGVEVVTSNTTMTGAATDKACEWVTVQNATVISSCKPTWTGSGCGKSGTGTTEECYSITTSDITYCATHTTSDMVALGVREISAPEEYITSYVCTKTSAYNHNWRDNPVKTSVSNTTIVNPSSLYQQSSDASICEYAYANQNATFTGTTSVGPATTGNALYDSLTAAFGDVSTLKLTYDGWASDGDINYATFYTSANQLMSDMERLTTLLAQVGGSQWGANALGLSKPYGSGEEVLTGISGTVSSSHTEESWMDQWNGVATNGTWDSYGFGLSGRENYCAARMAYNNAFASYVDAADPSLSVYTGKIREYYTLGLLNVGLPGLVCTDAFTDPESGLKEDINNDDAFNKIAALYEEYKSSPACAENGKLVYGTMTTINDTADVATDSNNAYGGNMFDYYNSYVNEISALYNAAQSAAGDGIIIIVSVEDGLVKCDVSPAEANPRND